MASRPFTLGAVAYDPKVVTIWEGFAAWFADHDFPFDYVLFSNYEPQAEAHLAGVVDVTWDSPLAWVRTRRLAAAAGREAHTVAIRDTDQDLTSVVLVRGDSDVANVAGLATALIDGSVDAACVIDGNQFAFAKDGTIAPGAVRILGRTATYDHCTMTVLDNVPAATVDRFVELLLSMSYDDPDVRPLLQLEGLTEWRPGRTSGYDQLEAAVDTLGFYSPDGSILTDGYPS